MEEILASIKRVIAEDGRAATTAVTAVPRAARRLPRAAPAAGDEDVLELDDPVSDGAALLSDDAASASRERLASLSALRQRGEAADQGALEAVVREMLRPMLKEWLDQRLPEIVEDIVSREVARITGRDL